MYFANGKFENDELGKYKTQLTRDCARYCAHAKKATKGGSAFSPTKIQNMLQGVNKIEIDSFYLKGSMSDPSKQIKEQKLDETTTFGQFMSEADFAQFETER